MNVLGFGALIRSEVAAWRAVQSLLCGKGRRPRCPACTAGQPYRLAEGRYRCRRCRHTFGLLTGRWLAHCRVSLQTWLWLIKLFELEVTALRAARQTGLSYPTAWRAFTVIRRALVTQEEPALLTREVEVDESYFGPIRSKRARGGPTGRGTRAKIPVFGVLERGGQVAVEVIRDASARSLLDSTVKLVKRGSIVYSDRWKGYDTLTFCGYQHLRVDHGRRFTRGRVHINGLEGFWSYAKGKLIRHRRVTARYFPLYLYEMQFRYNHRQVELFPILLRMLLQPVPNPL